MDWQITKTTENLRYTYEYKNNHWGYTLKSLKHIPLPSQTFNSIII